MVEDLARKEQIRRKWEAAINRLLAEGASDAQPLVSLLRSKEEIPSIAREALAALLDPSLPSNLRLVLKDDNQKSFEKWRENIDRMYILGAEVEKEHRKGEKLYRAREIVADRRKVSIATLKRATAIFEDSMRGLDQDCVSKILANL